MGRTTRVGAPRCHTPWKQACMGTVFLFGLGVPLSAADEAVDPRTGYDVKDYRIDLLVGTEVGTVQGFAGLSAEVVAEELSTIVLDLDRRLFVQRASWVAGDLFELPVPALESLEYSRVEDQVHLVPPRPLSAGESFAVVVHYSGSPRLLDQYTGFHVARTESGRPWISTSCQTIGAHSWWPCKANFFHPQDKNERLLMNITVPADLYAACNGRLLAVLEEGSHKTYRWFNEYPQPTYTVSMSIAPYVVLEEQFELPGLEQPLEVRYYVLAEDVERARVEFAAARELLAFFGERFGPFPYPKAKYGLAQTPVWGMEHATVIAYGNSFPTAIGQEGIVDPFALRNRHYDYILVHETAHEWWGNAITAAHWGDLWLHEGFACYAEALWVEHQEGLEAYLDFMQKSKRAINPDKTVFRPHNATIGEAFDEIVYDKGAFILHMLRYVMGDEKFFAAVKEFATDPRFLYRTTRSRDFIRICEKHHGSSLRTFFQPWLYAAGWPHYQVKKAVLEEGQKKAVLDITCRSRAQFPYVMPIDVDLVCEDGSRIRHRVTVKTGKNKFDLKSKKAIRKVEYPGFRWILCDLRQVP